MWDSPSVVAGEEGCSSPVPNDLRGRRPHRSGAGLLRPVMTATCATVSLVIGTAAPEKSISDSKSDSRSHIVCSPIISASSPIYSLRASDQSEALALSSRAVRGAPRREFEAVKPPRKARSDGQRDPRPARFEAGGSTSKDADLSNRRRDAHRFLVSNRAAEAPRIAVSAPRLGLSRTHPYHVIHN